ncbi:hypothetical protein LOTGIDRAFT_171183 [Lottia gigantea]|uniref:Uncharacterized protein n=1 Tax=Lottia gigantea TaxID=225164 RepID=V4AHV9_LOTGI|nr:hypothetical protein LOTGIDRAFT_171183 [Lottia gigantea]ESP03654.1 hypothetical protein LOTGIDRAFT_171183 [Lottia gigantea]
MARMPVCLYADNSTEFQEKEHDAILISHRCFLRLFSLSYEIGQRFLSEAIAQTVPLVCGGRKKSRIVSSRQFSSRVYSTGNQSEASASSTIPPEEQPITGEPVTDAEAEEYHSIIKDDERAKGFKGLSCPETTERPQSGNCGVAKA